MTQPGLHRHCPSASKALSREREWDHQADADTDTCDRLTRMLIVPWTPRDVHRAKGVRDDGQPGLSDAARDQLLTAIAKARRWMTDIACDKTTFAAIATQEKCGERHIRFLAPLAFVSPAIIAAIHAGRVPGDLTISALARNLPKDWASQDARILA